MTDIVDPAYRLHDIYRMRDLSGRLLYIGVTNGGLRRFMEHAKDKTWWREVAQIDVEHVHCSRPVIETIEREAIRTERPLYNVVHNVKRPELAPPTPEPLTGRAALGGRPTRPTNDGCWQPPNNDAICVEDVVSHPAFGTGCVVDQQGFGDHRNLVIKFGDTVGTRVLAAKWAPLTLVKAIGMF